MKNYIVAILLQVSTTVYCQTALTDDDINNLRLLYETALITTDRSYYYPGEIVWFQVGMQYKTPSLRDSLSKVLYAELLSATGETISHSILPIVDGGAVGQFKLSNSTGGGVFAIRVYTSWMKNFTNQLPYKPILVLSSHRNLICDPTKVNTNAGPLRIVPDQETYGCRKKVRLVVKIDSNEEVKSANLSAAVVDSYSCPTIKGTRNVFVQAQALLDVPQLGELKYPIEKGISINAKIINQKSVGIRSLVSVFQSSLGAMHAIESNDDGSFSLGGYHFYDSLPFVFQGIDRKGRPQGAVELVASNTPAPLSIIDPFEYDTVTADTDQRVVNTNTFNNDIRVLDEVVVEGKKFQKEVEKREKLGALYTNPDFVITGDELTDKATDQNWITALDGKIPGFQGGKVSRAKNSSFSGNTSPLILIDGVPLSVPLSSIPASSLDRVEIVKNASALYGSRGSNGIIAVYTKASGVSYDQESAQTVKPEIKYIQGYTRTLPFPAPVYSTNDQKENPDFRITIHWQPSLQFNEDNECIVEFFTADIATTYYVTIEGTMNGEPVRVIKAIPISCD